MIKYQSAVLFVSDIAASRQFYCDLLNQKVSMDHGPNVGFEGGFAIWQSDHALSIIYDNAAAEKTAKDGARFELYFESEDLDAIWNKLSAAKTPVVHPIREQPWGQRVFRVYDPDGHIVELGEPMPVVIRRYLSQGLTPEEVSQKVFMPLDVVRLMSGGEPA
jgi:catechol 2,3-dioxygenase-like lactoylglutathione lyase family enzyme